MPLRKIIIIVSIGGEKMSRVDRREFKDWKGFGARTRKCRESVGMTRERFAEMIGRTENYLLSLEKGDKSCSIHTLHQICTSLKESPDYILYGDGMEKEKENTDKEILLEIINKCNSKQLRILREVVVAIFPNFPDIIEENDND
jgi:transcriptional regulator with XRE-family HTH domain